MKRPVFRLNVRPVRILGAAVVVVCAGVVPAAAYSLAGAYDGSRPPAIALPNPASLAPAMPSQDHCASLLKPAAEDAGGDVIVTPAHKAAVLSLALGLQIAAGPLERAGDVPMRAAPLAVIHTIRPASPALRVSAWRDCRKQQVLNQVRTGVPRKG